MLELSLIGVFGIDLGFSTRRLLNNHCIDCIEKAMSWPRKRSDNYSNSRIIWIVGVYPIYRKISDLTLVYE
jgi:hypothetical protein